MNRRSQVVMIVAVVVAFVVGTMICIRVLFGPPSFMGYRPGQLREQLLCSADHRTVLEACRRLSTQVLSGELRPGTYQVRFRPDSVVLGFPEPIRALRPAYVAISEDGVVRLEMGSKWGAFGVYVYPSGYETAFPNARHGDRRLLEGLWFYDDNYRLVPNYDAEIDSILRDCGRLHE